MINLTIVRPDGQKVEQAFNGEQVFVGRDEKSDLMLLDVMVSRTHCIISREGMRFVLKDMESRNGTWINGRRIKNRRRLKDGDVIQIGPFRLFFHEDRSVISDPLHTQTLDMTRLGRGPFVHRHAAEQVIEPLGMITNYLSETVSETDAIPARTRRERLNRNLLTLYRITEQLVTTKDLDEILDYIMDQIFETFSPTQATILLGDKEENLVPRKQRSTEPGGIVRPISTTIVNRILNDRVAILTDNALEDPRFQMGESVIVDGIRSVMAAPIWEDRTILGIIYMDCLHIVGGYQTEDLDILTGIGYQTALAIQRWKLTEELRQEAIKGAVIRQNLARFHPDRVVDLIVKGGADLEVKETVATVLFCDIVGFTALCEEVNPKQLQELLNFFCKTVNHAVFEEQGTLDKFIGDAALTIFGAPVPLEDAPERAVRAALRIRDELVSVIGQESGLSIQVRYGINTGPAIVGNFGSDERMEYTILGHAVNVASRICESAEPNQILIGPKVFDHIKAANLFAMEDTGSRSLKGVKECINLYEVKDYIERH